MYVLWILKRVCVLLLFDGRFCKCQLDPVDLGFVELSYILADFLSISINC